LTNLVPLCIVCAMLNKFFGDGTGALYPITFYNRQLDSSFKMQTHSHHYVEIMYSLSGSFEVAVESADRKHTVNVHKGQFILISKDIPHKLTVIKNCKVAELEIAVAKEEKGFDTIKVLESIDVFAEFCLKFMRFALINDTEGIAETILKIHSKFDAQNKDGLNSIYMQSIFIQLCLEIAKSFFVGLSEQNSIYTKKAIQYISGELSSGIKSTEIAKRLNVSASYLHRLFKRDTGLTVGEFINKKRIEFAKVRLLHSKEPIQFISDTAGFTSRQNFHKVFYELTKTTPAAYRNEFAGKVYYDPAIHVQKFYTE